MVEGHYQECDVTDGQFPFSLDIESMRKMGETGILHVYTARNEDKVVGYVVNLVMPRHNTFNSKYAAQLGWYVDKDYRGKTGTELLNGAEEELKRMGVKACFSSHPVQTDLSPLFDRLGWKRCEINYFKRID